MPIILPLIRRLPATSPKRLRSEGSISYRFAATLDEYSVSLESPECRPVASLEMKRGMTQFRPSFADEAQHRRPVSAANGKAGVEAAVLTLARLTGRQIVRKEAIRHHLAAMLF